ncbi:MAG TPA: hypothetical protein VJ327_09560 [Patescibacteria group bacterium]|nr:hypothetical protein [Patescibacteria group bacterium]
MTKTYHFHDGVFSFWRAHGRTPNDITFRVRIDNDPEHRAEEKGIPFFLLFEATDEDILRWLDSHPDYKLLKVEDTDD